MSVTDANFILEGPIPGDEEGSWLLTGRRTYYDLVAGIQTDNAFPSFADLQAQASWTLGRGHRVTLLAIRSRENSDFDVERSNGDQLALLSDAENDLVSASLDLFLGSRWTSNTTVSWYRYRDVADFDGALRQLAKRSNAFDGDVASTPDDFVFNREFRLRDWSLRQNLTWDAAPRHTIELGGEIHGLTTAVRWNSLGNDRILQEANGSSVRGGQVFPTRSTRR